jgi:hypothetical protein
MAAIIHGIANTACPITGITMAVGAGGGQVRVGQGGGRVAGMMRWVDIKITMESRRGRANMGKSSSPRKTSTVAPSGGSASPATLFQYLSEGMSGITTVILFAG